MDIINLYDKENLHYVGGVVRDKLLGVESRDVDYVYEGVLEGANEFGTVDCNVASTRCEEYPRPGHLPVITKLGCPLKEDVLRRDFTINALYQRVSGGEILDFVNGIEDLNSKILRVLHDKSFIDDPTRIVRGLKFAVRLGFELDEHTKRLQDERIAKLDYDICFKRLKDELISAFNLNSQKLFERFLEQKIYQLFTEEPFNAAPPKIEPLVAKYKSEIIAPWLVYLGLFDLKRFELTKFERKVTEDFRGLFDKDLSSDFRIYRAFEGLHVESVLLYAAAKNQGTAERYLEHLRKIKLEITGEDLKALGFEPSKKYAEIFDYVLERKLQNPAMTREDELKLIQKF